MGSVTDSSASRNMRFLNTSRVCTASRFSLTSLKSCNMSEMSTSSCSAALSSCVPSSLSAALALEQKLFAGFEERECRVILQPDDPGQARQRVPDRRHAVVRELLERLVEEKDDGAQTAVIAQRLELFRRRRMPAVPLWARSA